MTRFASLEIHKDDISFSAGHFTIFSATEREQLHGHNYYVSIYFNNEISQNGMSFDYRYYKKKLQTLCDQLDGRFLLPAQSPYLKLEENDEYLFAYFDQKKIPFLKEDVVVLPLTNITIEELSHWFLQKLLIDLDEIKSHGIHGIKINVYNGPRQSGGASWGKVC